MDPVIVEVTGGREDVDPVTGKIREGTDEVDPIIL